MSRESDYQRQYYRANRERILATGRKWRAANLEWCRARSQAWYEAHRGECPAANRKRNYGLTPAAFESMKAAQQNRCAICGQEAKLCVDHDHATGKVRGLLCGPCNQGLGNFKDSKALLLAGADYIGKNV